MSKATVIHLETAVERKSLLDRMNQLFSLEVYKAKDGSEWLANPQIAKAHPLSNEPVSTGNLGCTHSHIDLIYRALANKESCIILLEDDCEFRDEVSKEGIAKFIHLANTLGEPWDILLLGATEYVDSTNASIEYKKVQRFWGTHALILRERGMRAALKAFHAAQMKGKFLPGDWLYSNAIRQEKLVCFGPSDPYRFCRQKEGLMSYLTGKARTY